MNRTCARPGCEHPVADGFVCPNCIEQLTRDLRALAGRTADAILGPVVAEDQVAAVADRGLIHELVTTMARLDVAEPDSGGAPWEVDPDDEPRTKDSPIATTTLPFRVPAAETIRDLHAELVTWTRHMLETRFGTELDGYRRDRCYRQRTGPGAFGPWRRRPELPPNDTRELALWLGRYRESIRQDEAGGELVQAIAKHASRARLVIFPRAVEYLGACPCAPLLCGCPDDGLRAARKCAKPHWLPYVDLYVARGSDFVTCPRCGQTDRVEERREWLLEQCRDVLVTAADGSRAMVDYCRKHLPENRSFTASAIRNFGVRGRLTVYAGGREDEDGDATLYKVGELMDLVQTIAEEEQARARRRQKTAV